MIVNGILSVKLLSGSFAAIVRAQQRLCFQAWAIVFPVEALRSRESILHEGKLLLRTIQSKSKYHIIKICFIST